MILDGGEEIRSNLTVVTHATISTLMRSSIKRHEGFYGACTELLTSVDMVACTTTFNYLIRILKLYWCAADKLQLFKTH